MNILSNPIVMCGGIALGIILVLILIVVISCKRSALKEREELMDLSMEIEEESIEEADDDKLENVLSMMQEALDAKEATSATFEEVQEENAIISYQELLASLGVKNSIDVDNIELYDDELENKVEISDFNKEIIEAYQTDDFDREVYRFQNDYSCEEMTINEVSEEVPVMIFTTDDDNHLENIDYEFKHSSSSKKFRSTDIISPVYGIINNVVEPVKDVSDDVEEILFDDDSLLDEF